MNIAASTDASLSRERNGNSKTHCRRKKQKGYPIYWLIEKLQSREWNSAQRPRRSISADNINYSTHSGIGTSSIKANSVLRFGNSRIYVASNSDSIQIYGV